MKRLDRFILSSFIGPFFAILFIVIFIIRLGFFRIVCLILMAVMTAAIVSFTGILGFIGLVAPHLVRLVIGSDNRFVVPLSMSVGALLMLVSDYLAFQFASIPVGVVLSVIGSPVFFALIVWQNKRTGAIY